MGNRQDKAKATTPVEVISMESFSDLHGNVDFLGMESKRLYNHIHQKLKVVQTWIFIQGILMVLLIAYAVLLGVWLEPFFPMNYEDTSEDGSSITLAGLQRDMNHLETSMGESNESVDYLHGWRKDHEESHISLNQVLADALKQINRNSRMADKVKSLSGDVSDLTKQNEEQRKQIEDLQKLVHNMEASLRQARAQHSQKLDDHGGRILKLECTTGNISSTVDDLINSTKSEFCDLTKELGTTVGRVARIETRISEEITEDIQGLQGDVKILKNDSSNAQADLQDTIDRQLANEKWAHDKFMEQDELRGSALEKQRVFVHTQMGELKCKLKSLNDTLHGRMDHIALNVTPSVRDCFDQKIQATQLYLEESIHTIKDNLEGELEELENDLKGEVQTLKDGLQTEKTTRTAQFYHMCDMVEGVNDNATTMFQEAKWDIHGNDKDINQLTDAVTLLQKTSTDNHNGIENLNTTQRSQKLSFLQFKEETVNTELDLSDRICTMEASVAAEMLRVQDVETRLGSTESAVSDMPLTVDEKVTTGTAKQLDSLAALEAQNIELQSNVDQLTSLVHQFMKTLGADSFTGMQSELLSVSSNSPAVATVEVSPPVAAQETVAVAMQDEPTPPDVPYGDYGEDYEEQP